MPTSDRPRPPRAALIGALVALVLGASAAPPAVANPDWVTPPPGFAGKIKKGEQLRSFDVSGLACAPEGHGERLCLIVDDETQGAQIAWLREGQLVPDLPLSLIDTSFGKSKPVELDPEAVAYAPGPDGGAFYVIGSHGRPRTKSAEDAAEDDAKALASKHVYRIPRAALPMRTADDAQAQGAAQAAWRKTMAQRPTGHLDRLLKPEGPGQQAASTLDGLHRFYDMPLEENGMTIEGLAVAGVRMFVGFRGPVVDKRAQILEVALDGVFGDATGAPVLHQLDLRDHPDDPARGVRDLIRYGEGFLILAGPVNDPAGHAPARCGDYAIYAWDGVAAVAQRKRPLPAYALEVQAYLKADYDASHPPKPEGLTALENGQLLVVFDGPRDGYPKRIKLDDGFSCPRETPD